VNPDRDSISDRRIVTAQFEEHPIIGSWITDTLNWHWRQIKKRQNRADTKNSKGSRTARQRPMDACVPGRKRT
jgi:hypothetical protein